MIKVLISHSLYPESFSDFHEDFHVIKPERGSFSYTELLEKIKDVDGMIEYFKDRPYLNYDYTSLRGMNNLEFTFI
jgi:hypothetical protein